MIAGYQLLYMKSQKISNFYDLQEKFQPGRINTMHTFDILTQI